jgi:hypothetical protein
MRTLKQEVLLPLSFNMPRVVTIQACVFREKVRLCVLLDGPILANLITQQTFGLIFGPVLPGPCFTFPFFVSNIFWDLARGQHLDPCPFFASYKMTSILRVRQQKATLLLAD